MRSITDTTANGDILAPSSRTLPDAPPSLSAIAGRLANHARDLLRAERAALLSVTADSRDLTTIVTQAWNAHCQPAAVTIGDGDPLRWRLVALEAAAHDVLAELVRRWPAHARPPAIGIFTDGVGVAFSPDNPSPRAPGWIARHHSGRCPTTILRPFAAHSTWTHLIAPVPSGVLH